MCSSWSPLKPWNPAVTGAGADWRVSVPGWSATAWWRTPLGVNYRKTEWRCVTSAYKGLRNESWRPRPLCRWAACHLFLCLHMYRQTVAVAVKGESTRVTVHIRVPKVFVPLLWRVRVTTETRSETDSGLCWGITVLSNMFWHLHCQLRQTLNCSCFRQGCLNVFIFFT